MMLIPTIVLGCSAVIFFVVSLFVAILRLATKSEVGVLTKDRSALDEEDHENVRATSIFDGEDIIGGSPYVLGQPFGPTGTSFTFHVYAPPTIEKEIPKVDLVGTLDFLTTGKVRKFVPIGAKRLLVINIQEMTLEVYLPKRGQKQGNSKPKHVSKNKKQLDSSTTAPTSDDTSKTSFKTSRILKRSGINISTKTLVVEDDADEEESIDDIEFEADDKEEVWSPRHFEAAPKTVLKLDDLISVSALSPNKYGGVIEILSCSQSKDETTSKSVPTGKEKEITPVGTLTQIVEEIEPPPPKSLKPFRRPSLLLEPGEDLADAAFLQWQGSSSRNASRSSFVSTPIDVNGNAAELSDEAAIVGAGIDETDNDDEINIEPNEVCGDEFVFRTPRDAAEFQRIVLALRTSGKEIHQLYEALETLQANSDAHFPSTEDQSHSTKKRVKRSNSAKGVPRFIPVGVALDDAWRCLNDVEVVKSGLRQYRQYSLIKSDKDDDIIAAAAISDKNVSNKDGAKDESDSSNEGNAEVQKRKELSEHYRDRRALLGMRDFFSLFVPPLPKTSPAVPHFSTCVASELTMKKESKFCGVEIHHLRLRLTSALQLRVGSAALYVRAYARAKTVVQEGWEVNLVEKEISAPEESNVNEGNENSEREEKESPTQISQKMTRLPYDNERANLLRDVGVRNECYEPALSPSQGYLLVGWHRFAIPPMNERAPFWLCPDKDPIDMIPSLKQIVTRHSDLHFVVVSFYNERTNTISYFLLVRSLPIGVDETFDSMMNNFINGSAKERDKMFEMRLRVLPCHTWTSLSKVAMQFVIVALFGGKKVNAFGAERSRISLPSMLVSSMTKVNHFGGSLRGRGHGSMMTNYVALGAHFTKITTTSLLLRHIDMKTCSVDYEIALHARGNHPKRVLSIVRMVNVDLQECTIPSSYIPINGEIVKQGSSLTTEHGIKPASDVTFWSKVKPVLRFAMPAKKSSRAKGEKQDELYSDEIDIIFDILDGVRVPAREGERIENKLVRLSLTRADIERFIIACECDLNAAVARIIRSQAWRFATFPIDQRLCRVELESGQFFHMGKDLQNNPIFCFKNSLPKPWAGNVRSTMLMILHRLETFFSSRDGLVKVTVIILTGCSTNEINSGNGKPKRKKSAKTPRQDDGEDLEASSHDADDGENGTDAEVTTTDYHIHSNFQFVQQMYELLSYHYPERLNKALIVASKAFPRRRISSFTLSPITQTRVAVLNTQAELKKYVAESELKKLGLAV